MTFVVAFSNFKQVPESASTNPDCMDDCEILIAEWSKGVELSGKAHQIIAERLRDDYNEDEFKCLDLYGGMRLLPSGHRRFYMLGGSD